ncbi:hypothetical protein TNCT_646011 [Trichonephila clavata]|uniref:Uncharacterized protein n=1 Tax=Trichonephila clavata TaxID=2740835 RepID=A0A8X6KFN9_TRICU|nr:hypothetical protein TNCT_646011 [Trichonephila clavata]
MASTDKYSQEKRRCLTLEEALEYFHDRNDNISEASSKEGNGQSDFAMIPPDLEEWKDEEDFNEDVLE